MNKDFMALWSDLDRELFEERAAIMEFDGGLTRDEAEQAAAVDVTVQRRGRAAGSGT